MLTILYPIPAGYFKGVTVTVPFHAKVRYEIVKGQVKIMEVAMSPTCLIYISNTGGLMAEIERELQVAHRNSHVHPLINTAMGPFMISN